MSFNIQTTPEFENEFKKLFKKYASLKEDILELYKELNNNPQIGVSLGGGFYKIRLAIKSKSKGKSGGGRVITFIKYVDEQLFLISIYDKGEIENVSIDELKDRILKIK